MYTLMTVLNTLYPSASLCLSHQAFGAQTVSGTGALRVGAGFLVRQLRYKTVYLSTPSWGEHYINLIISVAGECYFHTSAAAAKLFCHADASTRWHEFFFSFPNSGSCNEKYEGNCLLQYKFTFRHCFQIMQVK